MPKCVLQQICPKTNFKVILLINGWSIKFYAISKNANENKFPKAQSLPPCTIFSLFIQTVEVRQVEETVTFKKALCPARLKSCQQPK